MLSTLRRVFHARATALLAALAVMGLLGCEPNSGEVLPILPPLTIAAPDMDGLVRITGDASPDAQVFGFNETQGRGVIETATLAGDYVLLVPGDSGDFIVVWQRLGNVSSPPRDAVVPFP